MMIDPEGTPTPLELARQDRIDAAIRDALLVRDPRKLVMVLFSMWADEILSGRCDRNFWGFCLDCEGYYDRTEHGVRFAKRINKLEPEIWDMACVAGKLLDHEWAES